VRIGRQNLEVAIRDFAAVEVRWWRRDADLASEIVPSQILALSEFS